MTGREDATYSAYGAKERYADGVDEGAAGGEDFGEERVGDY